MAFKRKFLIIIKKKMFLRDFFKDILIFLMEKRKKNFDIK